VALCDFIPLSVAYTTENRYRGTGDFPIHMGRACPQRALPMFTERERHCILCLSFASPLHILFMVFHRFTTEATEATEAEVTENLIPVFSVTPVVYIRCKNTIMPPFSGELFSIQVV